jgi:flagellar biosynthesis/type III secretory pathway protein FliH
MRARSASVIVEMMSMSNAGADLDGIDFVPWKIPDFNADGGHHSQHAGSLAEKSDVVLKEAYSEGFESGRKEGVESARQETAGQVRQFIDVLDSLSRYAREFDQQIVRDLVGLSGKIAEQVILRELSLAPELMLAMVEKIIESIPTSEPNVAIYLHPHDATAFNDYLAGTQHQNWKIVEDVELNQGDCRLESIDSIVYSRLPEQINTILKNALVEDADSPDSA